MNNTMKNLGLAGVLSCCFGLSSCITTSSSLKDTISYAERAEKKGDYKEAAEIYGQAKKEIDYKIASVNLSDLKKSAEIDRKIINNRIEDIYEDVDGSPVKLMAYPFINPIGTLFLFYISNDLAEKEEQIKEQEKIVEALKQDE